MDFEDRLKELKRPRRPGSRAGMVRAAWDRVEREEGLSVKDKLERLITLTRTGQSGSSRPAAPIPERERRPPVEFRENPYLLEARYGRIPIGLGLQVPGTILSFLGRDPTFEGRGLDSAVFLDLETTGLAGGTGTVPFLIGVGYYQGGRFRVAQFFLGDLAEEGRLVRELARFFEEMAFSWVITYNGKAFDVPLLETRFALHRTPFPLEDLPHLDFLFSARSLWGHKYDSCRLFNLAREIVQAERDEDIPGAEIPLRYFEYIRTGNFELVEPILYHNQEDILSLLGVVVAGAALVDRHRDPERDDGRDAMDLFGVARLFERAGDAATSACLLEKALEGGLSTEVSHAARRKLSRHFKRNREWDKAVSLWSEAEDDDRPLRWRELAMHYEHRLKDYEQAIRAAERGLAVSASGRPADRSDFEKRIARLRKKIERAAGRL